MRRILRALCCLMLALFAIDMVQDLTGCHSPMRAEKVACHACACSTHMTASQPAEIISTPVVVEHYACEQIPAPEQVFVTQFFQPPRLLA